MQGKNVCNFILLLCISANRLFEKNVRFSFAVHCNCMVEKKISTLPKQFKKLEKKMKLYMHRGCNITASFSCFRCQPKSK